MRKFSVSHIILILIALFILYLFFSRSVFEGIPPGGKCLGKVTNDNGSCGQQYNDMKACNTDKKCVWK